MTWEHAYTEISSALTRANYDCSCGDEILVAKGTYQENIDFGDNTITLTAIDPNRNNTIIDGYSAGDYEDPCAVVTFVNNPNSAITGFTITDSDNGIHCANSTLTIDNCLIKNNAKNYYNLGHGINIEQGSSLTIKNSTVQNNGSSGWNYAINCKSSSLTVSNCLIDDNVFNGISLDSSSSASIKTSRIQNNGSYLMSDPYKYGDGISSSSGQLIVENCIINDNYNNGIYCSGSPTIINNWIYGNGRGNYGNSTTNGIYCNNSSANIRNNTITNNVGYGIYKSSTAAPTISNSIIWGNAVGQLYSCSAAYSCIENGTTENGNINSNPSFTNGSDPNNFHIGPNSPCIDTADPNLDPNDNETDIDGGQRLKDGDNNGTTIVDMGADEFYWSPADLDRDEIVNLKDYSQFAKTWLTTPNDVNDYNDLCDFEDNTIDHNDLNFFCSDWLWQPSWTCPLFIGCGYDEDYGKSSASSSQILSLAADYEDSEEDLKSEDEKNRDALDWLTQLYLTDQSVRDAIDQQTWQNIFESLKQELE